jgi:hypothetical protein
VISPSRCRYKPRPLQALNARNCWKLTLRAKVNCSHVSNPDLLKILSQGSEPTSIQEDFEKLFDAITKFEFGKSEKTGSSDKTIPTTIQEMGGSEKGPLVNPVKC